VIGGDKRAAVWLLGWTGYEQRERVSRAA
jgi:hypothetical protein